MLRRVCVGILFGTGLLAMAPPVLSQHQAGGETPWNPSSLGSGIPFVDEGGVDLKVEWVVDLKNLARPTDEYANATGIAVTDHVVVIAHQVLQSLPVRLRCAGVLLDHRARIFVVSQTSKLCMAQVVGEIKWTVILSRRKLY